MKILNSATRIVFILMAITVSVLTFLGIVESKDFILLAGMTFQYYYLKKTTETTV